MKDQVFDEYWSEIFDGIASDVVPLEYVESVSVNFKNNTHYDIPVHDLHKQWDKFSTTLYEFIKKYEQRVDSVSYNVDLEKIQKDISHFTSKFLASYNL